MMKDFVESVYPTSQHVHDTTSNTIDKNSAVIDDMHLPFCPMSEEYSSDHKTSPNANEWAIIDPISGKPRPPRQYEFLLILLENPSYSSYISWINKSEGSCKIRQPDKVAALWAKVKNRQTTGTMNYEVFARGIRFYYKSGLMIKTNKKHILRFNLPLNTTLV